MTSEAVTHRSVRSDSPRRTRELARGLAEGVCLPAVVGLVGPLGAGKTEFVKGLGWGLALDPATICSATFVIVCEYGTNRRLVHVDAYRLSGGEELDALGFDEMLGREDCLIAIEWADRVRPCLPAETLWVHLQSASPTERQITLETQANSPWAGIAALR